MTATTSNKKTAPKLDKKTQDALDACTTTASRIRLLAAMNMPKGDIARALNIRYQWVRNVMNTPLKKAD